MSPEKAAKKNANLLMLAFKDTSPDDPSVQVGLIAHGYQRGPSGRRYLLRSEAFATTTKAARNLAQLIDFYPLEKCISLLRTFVVEEKDRGTPLPQVQKLAKAYKPQQLGHDAFSLYERFRPGIPAGKKGWGAKGDLDLGRIGRLAKERR